MTPDSRRNVFRSRAAGRIAAIVAIVAVVGIAVAVFIGTCGRRDTVETATNAVEQFQKTRDDLRQVPAKLIEFEQTSTIDTQFEEPRGIAIGPRGDIYVAGDSAIARFGPDGTLRSIFDTGGQARCVAIAPDGRIYAGIGDHIEVFRPDGTRVATWPASTERSYPTCISVSEQGEHVYVADAGRRKIIQYDHSGRVVGQIPTDETTALTFRIPSPHFDVIALNSGRLVVTNPGRHRVQTIGTNGEILKAFGEYSTGMDGFCGCCNPTDIAMMGDGRIVTAEKGLPRVKVYTPDGELNCVVAAPEHLSRKLSNPDIAVDDGGRVIVLDPPKRILRIFQRNKSTPKNEDSAKEHR